VFLGLQGADSFRLIRRTSTGVRNVATYGGIGNPPNAWVRLVRRGTVVTSFKSNDGTNWTSAGSTTVRLGTVCYIGLAVSSGSNSTLNTAEFSNVRVTSAAAAVRPLKEHLLRLHR
jgi:regulation of enolase protein 1 (concanavalin A-like superfamily)